MHAEQALAGEGGRAPCACGAVLRLVLPLSDVCGAVAFLR